MLPTPNYSNVAVIATFLVIDSGVYLLPISNSAGEKTRVGKRKARDFNLITPTPREKIGILIIIIM